MFLDTVGISCPVQYTVFHLFVTVLLLPYPFHESNVAGAGDHWVSQPTD